MSISMQGFPFRRASGGTRVRGGLFIWALSIAVSVLFGSGEAWTKETQQSPPKAKKAPPAAKPAKPPQGKEAAPAVEMIEPKAIDILKASSERLAAAKSMAFTAVVTYEHPSRVGLPLAYTTKSDVIVQRPDKLRVLTFGDGPAQEFYYDGKAMMAYEPEADLVAFAAAPPTIDAALKAAYDSAAIYFPFTDLIVADPYKDIADGLKLAFYIGQSKVVGGTTTDMVAYANDDVFVQTWIGAEDKLPRMVRAVYRQDPSRLRHQLELSNWQLDLAVPTELFASSKALDAKSIAFARPDPQLVAGPKPPPKGKSKPAKTQPSKTQ